MLNLGLCLLVYWFHTLHIFLWWINSPIIYNNISLATPVLHEYQHWYADGCLLGCCTCILVGTGRRFGETRCLHRQGDEWLITLMMKVISSLQCQSISSRLHDATSQKAAMFILVAMRILSLSKLLWLGRVNRECQLKEETWHIKMFNSVCFTILLTFMTDY
jgi:hypothetical protein